MSLRSNGSYIGPRPAGPSSSVASGIWDLRSAERQQRAAAWPVVITGDPLFGNVSLLLHMNGSGSTFTDSSVSPKTITANGGIAQSATQSKFGGSSAYFDGSNDFLSVPYSSAFALGSGDWTAECWIYANSLSGDRGVFGIGDPNGSDGLTLRTSGSTLQFWTNGYNNITTQSGSISTAQWYHVALVRSGSTTTLYVNGASVATSSNAVTIGNPSNVTIGRNYSNASEAYWNGYIDELRITKGSDRGYTGSTITVPTAAFPDA
jgi:hypothetical protein